METAPDAAIDAFLAEFDGFPPFSTLESAVRDGRASLGTREHPGPTKWTGLIAYLIALELVGKYLKRLPTSPLPGARKKRQHLAMAIHYFGDGTEGPEVAATLFGLRCALVHGYGLQNAENKDLTYMFAIDESGGAMIRPARIPWDGTLANATNPNITVVNLWKIADYVDAVVARARAAHRAGEVALVNGVTAEHLMTFGTFVVGPTPR